MSATDGVSQKPVQLKDVMSFFGMTPKEMSSEWRKMTAEDKAQIIAGLSDGTYTY